MARLIWLLLLLLVSPPAAGAQTPFGFGGTIELLPWGTSAGQTTDVRYYELIANGGQYVYFQAPDSIPTIWGCKYPTTFGSAGQGMVTDGANPCQLSWVTGTGITVTGAPVSGNLTKFSGVASLTNGDLSGDCITSGTLVVTCAGTGVGAATYGQVTVNTKGWVTAGSVIADIAHGGTNTATPPADCQVLVATGATTYAPVLLGAGTNVTITCVAHVPTITAALAGGTVSTTGSPASGNLAKFSGTSSITNADLTGPVTTAGGTATTITPTGVAANTYGQVTVNIEGRVTAATVIEDVAHGGTGQSSFTPNALLLGNSTSPFLQVAPGGANLVLHGSSPPSYSLVNLVTQIIGNLPITNLCGGVGASSTTFLRGDCVWAVPAGGGTVTGSGATGNATYWSGGSSIAGDTGIIYVAAYGTSRANIQSAINAAPAGGVVQLDCVNYVLDGTALAIAKALRLQGCSLGGFFGATTLTGASGQTVISVATPSAVIIRDVGINPAGTGTALQLAGSGSSNDGSVLSNITVGGQSQVGINVVSARHFTIRDCRIYGVNADPTNSFSILVQNTLAPDSGDSLITGCWIDNSTPGTGVGILQLSGGGLKVIGNGILNHRYGFRATPASPAVNINEIMLAHNKFGGFTQFGIDFDTTGGGGIFTAILTGNILDDEGNGATECIHGLTSASAGTQMADLTTTGNSCVIRGGSGNGLLWATAGSGVISGVTVVANTFDGIGSSGSAIGLGVNVSNFCVGSNAIWRWGSASVTPSC